VDVRSSLVFAVGNDDPMVAAVRGLAGVGEGGE